MLIIIRTITEKVKDLIKLFEITYYYLLLIIIITWHLKSFDYCNVCESRQAQAEDHVSTCHQFFCQHARQVLRIKKT